MKYDLDCRYDSRASFYGKAVIEEYEDDIARTLHLLSYGTFVANIVYYKNGKVVYEYFGKYSQTTTRHQKEFFKQNGLSDKEIKELFDKETLEIYE